MRLIKSSFALSLLAVSVAHAGQDVVVSDQYVCYGSINNRKSLTDKTNIGGVINLAKNESGDTALLGDQSGVRVEAGRDDTEFNLKIVDSKTDVVQSISSADTKAKTLSIFDLSEDLVVFVRCDLVDPKVGILEF